MRNDDQTLPEILEIAAIPAWDEEADVIVIGYGMAGACAALEALKLRAPNGSPLSVDRPFDY